MTHQEINALGPGSRIRVQLRLDHEVEGRILSVSANGIYIEWDDMDQPTFEPWSKLKRTNWSALERVRGEGEVP
jgi:hypothetical protein